MMTSAKGVCVTGNQFCLVAREGLAATLNLTEDTSVTGGEEEAESRW